jgi:hypothetical protein
MKVEPQDAVLPAAGGEDGGADAAGRGPGRAQARSCGSSSWACPVGQRADHRLAATQNGRQKTVVGRRDFAVLAVLSRLGLRPGPARTAGTRG